MTIVVVQTNYKLLASWRNDQAVMTHHIKSDLTTNLILHFCLHECVCIIDLS